MKATTFQNLLISHKDKEGLVCLGCGGSLDEWVTGLTSALHEAGISPSSNPNDIWEDVFILTTTGERIDLFFVFKEPCNLDLGKMAIWRLRAGDASWWSDYMVNYAEQHGVIIPEEKEEEETEEA